MKFVRRSRLTFLNCLNTCGPCSALLFGSSSMQMTNQSCPHCLRNIFTVSSSIQVTPFQVTDPFSCLSSTPLYGVRPTFFLLFLLLLFFFHLYPMLAMLHSSSSWPLILDVESCQVLFKNQSVLCTATKSPSSCMTGISSRHCIRFVEHDLPSLGPCSLPSRECGFPGVLPPHPSRMLPRIPCTSPFPTPK